jgi:hypothetical protein
MRDLRLWVIGALTLAFSGCAVVGGVFKVGMWAGVLMILAVVAVIWLVASRFR